MPTMDDEGVEVEYWVIERMNSGAMHGDVGHIDTVPVATFPVDAREAVTEYCDENYEHWVFVDGKSTRREADAIVNMVKRY